MSEEVEVFITVDEASRITSIKRGTLYRMAREGRCPAVQVPGTKMVRFPRSALLRWMASGTLNGKA